MIASTKTHASRFTATLGLLTLSCTLVALLSACGPVQSTITINEAEVAFEKATLTEANVKAPYEFYSAQEYLHKAKEEWGYSDFEAALDYADLARKFSEEAVKKAKGKPSNVAPAGITPSAVTPSAIAPKAGTRPIITDDPEADALE